MHGRTHTTAVVVIPPQDRWEPIQAIRRAHDRQVRRWMPHITMIYPFVFRDDLDAAAERLAPACLAFEPFDVRLTEFRHFHHGKSSCTLRLAPEPPDPLVRLYETLRAALPEGFGTHGREFVPHLSVGQVRGLEAMSALKQDLQAAWRPLSFRVDRVSLIWRDQPPDDVFRIDRHLSLGRQ